MSNPKIVVKRIYDTKEKSDGYRVLVDRLWPRGITKTAAKVDIWLKEITPSHELRAWFHQDKEKRFQEFSKKYQTELSKLPTETLKTLKNKDKITLVTAVKNIEHSHLPTLKAYLENKL